MRIGSGVVRDIGVGVLVWVCYGWGLMGLLCLSLLCGVVRAASARSIVPVDEDRYCGQCASRYKPCCSVARSSGGGSGVGLCSVSSVRVNVI